MSTLLPHRVRLHRAPLHRVICQLRYPTELGFTASLVRPLQKQLADEYPEVSQDKIVSAVRLAAAGGPPEVTLKDIFRFRNTGGTTLVQVTDEFVALETTAYSDFDDFANRWRRLATAAVSVLQLHNQTRLGLRYTNAIVRQEIETLEQWRGHIADELLAGFSRIGETLKGQAQAGEQAILTNVGTGLCAFRHGFPAVSTILEPLPQQAYIIDIDTYDETLRRADVEAQVEDMRSWNHHAVELLRASVTAEQWSLFEPETLA